MANVFTKGTKLAQVALALLRRTQKAAGLFKTRYGITDFKGSEGDVINVKRPAVLRARDKGWRNDNAITFDRLVQSKIQIRLNKHPYSAVELQPEEYTLDVENYATDVTKPQVDALIDWYEDLVVDALGTADFVYEVTFNPNAGDATAAASKQSDPRKVASRARRYFQEAHVPLGGRYWLVGSAVAEAIRDHGKLLDVDTSGLPEALRDGVVTKLSGFIVVEVDALEEDESYFVHESAVAIASVAPAVPPQGVAGGGVAATNGIGLTQLWDYDGDHLKRSIIHSFAGSTVITDPELDENEQIVLDEDDEPQFEFVRGIRVVFVPVGETDDVAGDGSADFTVTVTGTPTGGTFSLLVDGEETDAIPYNASNAAIADAINEIEGVSGAEVAGGTFPANAKTVHLDERVSLVRGDNNLTGGTAPNVTVAAV
jgi:hypothetical protein